MSERKARHGSDNRLGRAVANVLEAQPKHDKSYFIWVVSAHLARRAYVPIQPTVL
jgi:hypothetical protein